MRQKYEILFDAKKSTLTIREYAIIDKDLKNVETALLRDDQYALRCEETHDGAVVSEAIARGPGDLVELLRTPNLFSIGPHASRIAEAVTALYRSETDRSVELTFDDIDLIGD